MSDDGYTGDKRHVMFVCDWCAFRKYRRGPATRPFRHSECAGMFRPRLPATPPGPAAVPPSKTGGDGNG